ncbi:MAG: hypothetical protein L0387_18040 [Acidobacteria bacterium]|nr:hypothetical protein [Acidobacteriota bacterium]MCI0720562.1 hypothetical protein [Acidobacteriota bacterium]
MTPTVAAVLACVPLASPPLLYHLGVMRLRRMPGEAAWNLIRRSAAANYPPARDLLKQAQLTRYTQRR